MSGNGRCEASVVVVVGRDISTDDDVQLDTTNKVYKSTLAYLFEHFGLLPREIVRLVGPLTVYLSTRSTNSEN